MICISSTGWHLLNVICLLRYLSHSPKLLASFHAEKQTERHEIHSLPALYFCQLIRSVEAILGCTE